MSSPASPEPVLPAPAPAVAGREPSPVIGPVAPLAFGGALLPEHVLALQGTSGNVATTRWLATARAAAAPPRPPKGIPAGGTAVNKVGVVGWEGTPRLHLRSRPDTDRDSITGELDFNTRLQVLKSFPGDWYYVSTADGRMGYVYSVYVRTHLPEPGAKLHKIETGPRGFAINIAQKYYGDDVHWGQDLRFYVNALAFANDMKVPNTPSGWKQVQFDALDYIWIPSKSFALSLKGTINSGSYSYEALDELGLADFVARLAELYRDFEAALAASRKYLGPALRRHVTHALMNVVESLIVLMIGAIVILAIMSVVGAVVVGAVTGGAGAAIGAELGFEAGMMLLDWLGLVFLVAWLGQAIVQTGTAFAKFMAAVVGAHGDPRKLDQAGRLFAEAIATLAGNLLEAAAFYVASVGGAVGIAKLRDTRFGKLLGKAFFDWLGQRDGGRREGRERVEQRERAQARDDDVAVDNEDFHTGDELYEREDPLEAEVDPAMCFPAGTPIHTPQGVVPIESVAVGDEVLAYDFEAGQTVARAITSLTRGTTERWVLTRLAGGGELRATPAHKFWVESAHDWIAAEDIEPGMALRLVDGSLAVVEHVGVEETGGATFNFGVDEIANYYAGEAGILVHNIKLKRSRLARLARPGYWNYELMDNRGRIYYEGMAGPNETERGVRYRHRRNRNRFNPRNGDQLERLDGLRTYGEARLMEHRRTQEKGTYIGRRANDYRGNRQQPIAEAKLPEYQTYVDEYLRKCG